MKHAWKLLGLLSASSVLALSACKEDEFVFFRQPYQPVPPVSTQIPIKQVIGDSQVDILWVIDDSGSMSSYQQEVINNTALFMQEFTKDKHLSWSMGLISTDESRLPLIGFTPATLLNSQSPNPVSLFQNAVRGLGTYGSGYEKTFVPIQKHLDAYPGFMRKNAYLAIITVTDAEEQSGTSSTSFLQYLVAKKGDLNRTIFFGAFGAYDLGCTAGSGEGIWNYVDSPYEDVVQATRGRVFPICTQTFGKDLSELGKDLVKRVTQPMIRLAKRPKISSIRVSFKGQVLPGGLKEDGGFWIYDFDGNAIVFHDLDFAPGDTETVDVSYQEDDGLP
jgi:hypothetical protein